MSTTVCKAMLRLGLAMILTVSGLVLAGPASSASAATARNGLCEPGEFCLYWALDQHESVSDFTSSVPNYGSSLPTCYVFKGPGAGNSECVKNNAMSVWNRAPVSVTVFFNSYYQEGSEKQTFLPGQAGNLSLVLINNNASHRFG